MILYSSNAALLLSAFIEPISANTYALSFATSSAISIPATITFFCKSLSPKNASIPVEKVFVSIAFAPASIYSLCIPFISSGFLMLASSHPIPSSVSSS